MRCLCKVKEQYMCIEFIEHCCCKQKLNGKWAFSYVEPFYSVSTQSTFYYKFHSLHTKCFIWHSHRCILVQYIAQGYLSTGLLVLGINPTTLQLADTHWLPPDPQLLHQPYLIFILGSVFVVWLTWVSKSVAEKDQRLSCSRTLQQKADAVREDQKPQLQSESLFVLKRDFSETSRLCMSDRFYIPVCLVAFITSQWKQLQQRQTVNDNRLV